METRDCDAPVVGNALVRAKQLVGELCVTDHSSIQRCRLLELKRIVDGFGGSIGSRFVYMRVDVLMALSSLNAVENFKNSDRVRFPEFKVRFEETVLSDYPGVMLNCLIGATAIFSMRPLYDCMRELDELSGTGPRPNWKALDQRTKVMIACECVIDGWMDAEGVKVSMQTRFSRDPNPERGYKEVQFERSLVDTVVSIMKLGGAILNRVKLNGTTPLIIGCGNSESKHPHLGCDTLCSDFVYSPTFLVDWLSPVAVEQLVPRHGYRMIIDEGIIYNMSFPRFLVENGEHESLRDNSEKFQRSLKWCLEPENGIFLLPEICLAASSPDPGVWLPDFVRFPEGDVALVHGNGGKKKRHCAFKLKICDL